MRVCAARLQGLSAGSQGSRRAWHSSRLLCSGFDGLDATASLSTEAQLTEMLQSVKKGRLDLALSLAGPLAAALDVSETAQQFLARECSERAWRSHEDGRESRERGIALAVSGATFDIPGRLKVRPAHLAEGFWLRDVSDQHHRADTISKLARCSLALRGLESADAAEALQQRCRVARSSASEEEASTAETAVRDLLLVGRSAVVKLQTSRSAAVLQSFVAREFAEGSPGTVASCPALLNLLLRAGHQFTDSLGELEPAQTLQEPVRGPAVLALRLWADRRQLAAARQMTTISEIISEACSGGLLPDPKDGLDLLNVAETFFQGDCPLKERRQALSVFRRTAERLREQG
ncbi:unnamed protein product [Polarella glacialis]|uniref:Uncharacterized protein n=1 Tax=Polarella glacialis TaxID=89957 RepID=A0A813FWG0_POLGL|nr:unnamed protein product [Polarella glacialis]